MPSHTLSFPRRLSSNRPLRPPNITKRKPRLRLLTQNSQQRLISPQPPRPQLPFLHPPSGARPLQPLPRNQFQYSLSRILTTERKSHIRISIKIAARWSLYGWSLYGLFTIVNYGFQSELLERQFPTPPDWSLLSKLQYRNARGGEDPNASGTGYIDYAHTGKWYMNLLARLENPGIDGAGLEPALKDEGDIYVAGVGKAGLNITSKSEPWRRGYHACLMGAACAAEHLDGWVTDTTRKISFPPNMVVGPSNPRPKPVPYGAVEAPLEANCVPAFGPPESFYMKILTTQGFSTRQRLDAALAYADWLDFKGLHESAEAMYDWGLDIAMGALPVEAHNVVEIKSGIINAEANHISSNILLATTSLALHHARHMNFAAAFPIFLSVLRATRQLPSPPEQNFPAPFDKEPLKANGLLADIKRVLNSPPYPAAPPTGDEPQLRTPLTVCEEAGIMAHIGEIVFASASSATKNASTSSTTANKTVSQQSLQAGINWTRDAVDIAESTFLGSARQDGEARKKCAECIKVGLGNWEKMVARMIRDAAPQEGQPNQPGQAADSSPAIDTAARGNSGAGWNIWSSITWPWRSSRRDGSRGSHVDADAHGRWQREAELVREKRMMVRTMLRGAGLSEAEGDDPEADGSGWGLLFR